MINNLFSSFDPSSTLLSSSWLIFIFIGIIVNPAVWNINAISNNINNNIILNFNNEISFTLGNTENGTEIIIIAIFFIIITINLIALFPQNFSLTSHLSINLPLAISFWATILFNGWCNNTKHMLAHLLPQGTPTILIPFMVMIELTSNIIRPITLCVRLTANLIAGHLLITLLGNLITSISPSTAILIIVSPLLLTILESAVACIQAYVFITLITMYTTEIN